MEESGFEPPNSERAVLQTAAFSHFAIPPLKYSIILTKKKLKCKNFWQLFYFFQVLDVKAQVFRADKVQAVNEEPAHEEAQGHWVDDVKHR